jgi:VanZ family protein
MYSGGKAGKIAEQVWRAKSKNPSILGDSRPLRSPARDPLFHFPASTLRHSMAMTRLHGRLRWLARMLAAATAAYTLVLVFATHYPKPEELLGPNAPSDKMLHFLAYAALAILAGGTLVMAGRWSVRGGLGLAAGLAVFGVVDEITQPFFSRDAEPLDWAYDCIGIAGGLLVVAVLAGVFRAVAHAAASPSRSS